MLESLLDCKITQDIANSIMTIIQATQAAAVLWFWPTFFNELSVTYDNDKENM